MKVVVSIFIFLISISLHAQQEIAMIDSIMESKLSDSDPGLFLGIVKDGKVIYEGYKGLASLQHQVKINETSRSNIASVAKQFVALMILDLDQRKKLSLEEDIRKYLPELYINVEEEIKIRHLINHTSGIRDFYDLMSIQQKPWWRRAGLDNDDAIELLAKQEDLAFAPGSRRVYSNSGYTLLCKIISLATGEDFHDYSEKFFKSLGMDNTYFLKNYMLVIPNLTLPYSDWGNGIWKQYPMLTNLYGDGFLYTTLEDQLAFEASIQNARLKKDSLLIKSQKPIPNSEFDNYGFGLELEDRLNYRSVHHSGATGSYHAQTLRFPEEQLSIFVMSSNSRLWSGYIADEIAEVLLPKKTSVENYDARLSKVDKSVTKKNFLGQYISESNYVIRIGEEDGKIMWRNANNNPIQLMPEGPNKYSYSYDERRKVCFFEDQMIVFFPSGKTSVYTKIALDKVRISDLESYTGHYLSQELDVEFSIIQKDEKLLISLEGWKNTKEVEVVNRNELLVNDYIMKIERDQFDRVIGILLTTNRILNNKFIKKTNLIFQPQIETTNGSIQVTTIHSQDGNSSQILLTKNLPNGNEIWSQQFGGSSYDRASSILEIEDGYLILGSTSSYGKGNYDMFLIKTDKKGKKLWQKTYGGFGNEYGFSMEAVKSGYILKGTIQKCNSNSDVFNRKCTTNVWFVTINDLGNELSQQVLEEVNL